MSIFTLEEVNQAINMAVDETSRKAVEVLSSVLDNWVHGGDADCIIAEFEEKLNEAMKENILWMFLLYPIVIDIYLFLRNPLHKSGFVKPRTCISKYPICMKTIGRMIY